MSQNLLYAPIYPRTPTIKKPIIIGLPYPSWPEDERAQYNVKKIIVFPAPAGMSLTKLSQGGNNLIVPG